MTYIPKNRIKENLYTPGEEFIILSTKENYSGYYYSLYNGEFYTGKNVNSPNIRQLVKFTDGEPDGPPPNLDSENRIALFLGDPDPTVDKSQWNQRDIVTYLNLKNEDPQDENPRSMPQFYYASPTEDDYALGSFTRYFIVRINYLQYLEVNKETYDTLKSKSSSIVWELFEIFKMQWTLTGIESEAFDTNRSQVLIAENKINRRGLQEFLSNDYIKYYISENINNQYTSGDDYTLPSGQSYQGLYHVMPNGIAMTGRFHGEAEDILLTPLSN